ncbi:MAG TPA: hypothetical protein VM012_01645, partial [Flavitalea sp.]|nr:hypothetical protein [Flavitalea sp.]
MISAWMTASSLTHGTTQNFCKHSLCRLFNIGLYLGKIHWGFIYSTLSFALKKSRYLNDKLFLYFPPNQQIINDLIFFVGLSIFEMRVSRIFA